MIVQEDFLGTARGAGRGSRGAPETLSPPLLGPRTGVEGPLGLRTLPGQGRASGDPLSAAASQPWREGRRGGGQGG